jgi:hypothetical protein
LRRFLALDFPILDRIKEPQQRIREDKMWHFNPGLLIPLGAFVMVIAIVAIKSMRQTRENELRAHQDLRTREMEHERKMKELEIERAKIELEKIRSTKSGEPVSH